MAPGDTRDAEYPTDIKRVFGTGGQAGSGTRRQKHKVNPMPGRIPGPFRPGNLAETLGVLLLRGISAVAEVPRPDDVGIDVFSTLLRCDEEDGHYYAEEPFVVQIKSASVPTIDYSGHALKWLVGQLQPMFIGRVSLHDSNIALYPTWSVNQAVAAMHAESATIHFTQSSLPEFFRDVPSRWVGKAGTNEVTVYLPEPLLRWSTADLTDKTWREAAYETLKRYIAEHRRANHAFLFGESTAIMWSPNDADSIRSNFTMATGHPSGLADLAEQLRPGLQAMLMQAISMPDEAKSRIILPLMALAIGLRKAGLEIDPQELFFKLGGALLPKPESVGPGRTVYELIVRYEGNSPTSQTSSLTQGE